MTGLLTLSEHVLCRKEVLGKTFRCENAGIAFQLYFPQYPLVDETNPDIGFINPLRPPKIGEKWKRGDLPLDWGYPMRHPAGDACVELLAVSIECDEEKAREYAYKLYESIETWEHAFIDYIKLETKQGIERDRNIHRNTCCLELMQDKYIPDNREITVFATCPRADLFASKENILNAIAFANSGKELFLEYQMLLSAYEAIRLNQNRRAILDACSAMELSLLKQINSFCLSIGLSPDILTSKYRYLGERIALLKKISAIPNDDYETLLIEPRNSVMHNKNIYPSNNTTDKLIACVEGFLRSVHVAYY